MIGYEATSNQYDGFNDVEYGYYPDRGMAVSYEYDKESAGSSVLNNSSLEKHTVSRKNTKNNAVSAYATLVYALKNRYIFNANLRGDASNRFGQYTNHKFLPVWSLAARWKINDESWFRDWKALDDFSIRFSYGQQGNIPTSVGPNLVAQYMALAVNRFSGNYQLGIKRLPYPDLRWEKTVTTNYGLDISLLNGRISGTVDYYVRKGKDLIFSLPVASEYGTTQTFRNGASMKNYGIEVVSLIAPTSEERIKMIAADAEGFVYAVSSLGVTGVRNEIKTDLESITAAVKEATDIPVAIGFGISTPEQAKKYAAVSDGVIVGSAIVKIIEQYGKDAPDKVYDYVKSIKDAIR